MATAMVFKSLPLQPLMAHRCRCFNVSSYNGDDNRNVAVAVAVVQTVKEVAVLPNDVDDDDGGGLWVYLVVWKEGYDE